ncbi:MAG TPA: hypothetical protein VF937_02960 [Chloroflexota bacterium]
MRLRAVAVCLAISSVCLAACGGGPRSTNADLASIRQPTPDPTLDAVVRDLPRALAGVAPTATPTLVVVPVPKISARAPTLAPTPKPAVRQPTPVPTRVRR